MIKRRALWTFALAAPAVVAAGNLMPVVAPPTWAIQAGGLGVSGGGGRTRTCEDRSRRIYSPDPLPLG